MAESTATIEGTAVMNIAPGFIANTARSSAEHGLTDHPISLMEDTVSGDTEIATPVILTSHNPSPIPLKGTKNNIMFGATPIPHPFSMSTENNSLHHFQTDGNSIYTHTNSAFIHAALGPISNSDSPSYSSSTVPSSTTAAFMAMHGHNTSLYESPRRNSVPTLTADQAEHKRKISSEEKTLQRQASWSSFSSSSTAMSSFQNASLSGLHQLDATNVDPTMMHYYRTQFSQHHPLQQSHSLNQAMPSSNNSSACPSPMPESFMPGSVLNNISSSPLDDVLPSSETGGIKVKRNNSVCSTTSMSSTSSSSNNKHPCKSPNCGWSFKRYEHLKRHLLVHSKERSFVCDFSGCDKSFSRSDNFSAHLRTHSKKGSDHRRRNSRAQESNCNHDAAVKQEILDHEQGSSLNTLEHQNSESGFGHSSTGYASGSMSQEPSESGQESSPARSPGSTRAGISSSVKEEDRFGMIGHSGYAFGNNALYSMDPLDSLNSMVPRFNTIQLNLKSVAPNDIHKPSFEDDSHSHVLLSAGNPNGESPHPSPMPHYEQFTFPSSISTHFMPILQGRFSIDHTGLQQQQLQQSHMHDTSSQNPYASLPSTETSGSSASSLHHHLYHSDQDLRGFQFTNAVHGIGSQLQYPSTPMNEDEPMHPLHSNQSFHPHVHLDFYDTKIANPQMLHHPFSSLQPPSSSALPPHPLMSTSAFSAPGLNEPLYSSSSTTSSTHSNLLGSRAISQSSTVMDNSKRSSLSSTILPLSDLTISTPTLASQRQHPLPSVMMRVLSTSSDYSDSSLYASSSPPSFSSRYLDTHSTTNSDNITGTNTSSANTSASISGTSTGLGSGSGSSSSNSKHGGSGKHHTCSVIGCSKRFKRLEHLKRHIKTHTQERPFNCPYTTCSKRFSRSDNLAQHVKTHQRQINKLQMKHRSQAQAQAQVQQGPQA